MTRSEGDAPVEPADPVTAGATGDDVPRLPRGRGIRLSRPELLRVAGLAALLVFLVVTQRPCADAVSKFVTSFGDEGSAKPRIPRPGTVDLPAPPAAPTPGPTAAPAPSTAGSTASPPAGSAGSSADGVDGYERLRPGMTDAEIEAAIRRARARAAGSAAGSGR